MVKEEGLSRACSTTTTSAAPGSSGSSPRTSRPRRSRRPTEAELGDFRDGAVPDRPPRPGPGVAVARGHGARPAARRSSKSIRLGGDRLDPSWSSRSRSTTAATRRSRRASGSSCRSTCSAAAATRRPGTTSRGERTAHDGTGQARRASTRSATATTGSAWRSRPARAGRGRLVEPDRDRVQLRVRLRARLPGQRPAALVAGHPGARRVPPVPVAQRSPSPATGRADGGGGTSAA